MSFNSHAHNSNSLDELTQQQCVVTQKHISYKHRLSLSATRIHNKHCRKPPNKYKCL